MATQPTPIVRESFLRAQEIRELIRDAHGAFAPDHVARALRDRYMEPLDIEASEIAELLGDLVDMARRRIEEQDIEPVRDEKGPVPKLPKRERESAANLAMLMATRSVVLAIAGRAAEALEVSMEGLAWGRTSRDHLPQTMQWMALHLVYERLGKFEEQTSAIVRAVEIARESGSPRLRVEAMKPLVSDRIEKRELDEAERLNMEMFSILQNDLPDERRHPYYALALMDSARIALYRGQLSECLQGLREALRWADATSFPMTRCSILSHLGGLYVNLTQYRQCIECQQELVEIADAIGSVKIKGWAYNNLADAHKFLKEYDQALELLDQAEHSAMWGPLDLDTSLLMARAEVLFAAERLDEAAACCLRIIERGIEDHRSLRVYSAFRTLGEIEEKCSRYESAEAYYRRAVEVAKRVYPDTRSAAQIGLARVLSLLNKHDEALATLDDCNLAIERPPEHQAKVLRVRATIAEAQGDLRAVIDYEREAVTIEQELLELQAEQSLRNARIIAETDLLEREAELERERRRRLERELANAVVALSDSKRQAAVVEERLRKALVSSAGGSERAVTTALREALTSLRTGAAPQETVHHYLAKVDEEFQQRLRQRYPNLTRKQERLCGLIRTGLDSKEIGSLLGLEPEGLKALRKRLRKALDIAQEETLETFLAGV
jgi:tetratricopeptide (TPR) repeat protein